MACGNRTAHFRQNVSLSLMTFAACLVMTVALCSCSIQSPKDMQDAVALAESRTGVNVEQYGMPEKSYYAKDGGAAAYLEVKLNDEAAAEDVDAALSGILMKTDLTQEEIPPCSGHEIRKDLDGMDIVSARSALMSSEDNSHATVSVHAVVAEKNGAYYLFYFG